VRILHFTCLHQHVRWKCHVLKKGCSSVSYLPLVGLDGTQIAYGIGHFQSPLSLHSDSTNQYLEHTVCNGGYGKVFTMESLSRGVYTVEMTASKNGGEFNVQMMCSNEPPTEMDEIDGTSTTVYSTKFSMEICNEFTI